MYTKEGTIQDRREQLRVKCKSLAEEARIIRREELRMKRRKLPENPLYEELHLHRTLVVRPVAREAHLAYGLIRGRSYSQMERTCKKPPDWKAVKKLVGKYGPSPFEVPEDLKKEWAA